ncbi:MAG: hypothetical protein MR302_00150 [Lachnospiraceae bacterium]|nr:hypothetical protein [Lachnospiraceae bacterium]
MGISLKMNAIPIRILDKVDNIIKEYSLFEGKNVCVAYSGGKDSFFLCMVMKELGYEVSPVIIDIGYNSDWSVALRNIEYIGLNCVIIDAEQINQLMPEIKDELKSNLTSIEQIKNGSLEKVTICTPCHNSKMVILQKWAEINNIHTIANGHHAIDAISSLLKSFYMFLDRWEYQHEEFVYENFYKLILSQKKVYTLEKEKFITLSLCDEITRQIEAQNVGTDEPILQYFGNTSTCLCRPLFGILESEIVEYFDSQNFFFNESECFVTNHRDKKVLTPRELIQYELLKNAPQSLLLFLLELVKENLDKNGFLKFNVRNNRTRILGNSYKNEKINIIKK